MPHFALSAVGADRPGIVAAVTGAFAEHGCNLEDSSMTILRGQFAMMLIVDAPAGVGAGELQATLAGPAADLDLVVTVRPADEPPEVEPEVESWTVSVYGADHPGIVHGVASLLAEVCDSWLLDRPYNQGSPVVRARRLSSWDDAVGRLCQLRLFA